VVAQTESGKDQQSIFLANIATKHSKVKLLTENFELFNKNDSLFTKERRFQQIKSKKTLPELYFRLQR